MNDADGTLQALMHLAALPSSGEDAWIFSDAPMDEWQAMPFDMVVEREHDGTYSIVLDYDKPLNDRWRAEYKDITAQQAYDIVTQHLHERAIYNESN